MRAGELLEHCSLDMAGRHLPEVPAAASVLPPGTRVNIGAANGEAPDLQAAAAAAIAAHGLTPVPHLAARRIPSPRRLHEIVARLRRDATGQHLFIAGGDPTTPTGPYPDALTLIRSLNLAELGARTVAVAGYPEGHPAIPTAVLREALELKITELAGQEIEAEIITQLGFAVGPVLAWVEQVRAEGITAPIRIGVSGPLEVRRLRGYAQRVGADLTPAAAARYGLDRPDPSDRVGPEAFVAEIAERLDPAVHGIIGLHLFSLGGLAPTAQWLHDARRS